MWEQKNYPGFRALLLKTPENRKQYDPGFSSWGLISMQVSEPKYSKRLRTENTITIRFQNRSWTSWNNAPPLAKVQSWMINFLRPHVLITVCTAACPPKQPVLFCCLRTSIFCCLRAWVTVSKMDLESVMSVVLIQRSNSLSVALEDLNISDIIWQLPCKDDLVHESCLDCHWRLPPSAN